MTIPVGKQTLAEEILAHDPAIKDQVFAGTVHPWYPVDWDTYGATS